jgi:hypothetical protein
MMLINKKLWLNAVLLGSMCFGGAAMADKEEDAARARDKAEKAADKARVRDAKAIEKENKADRARRRRGVVPATRVIEHHEHHVVEPAPTRVIEKETPAPDVNVQINNE